MRRRTRSTAFASCLASHISTHASQPREIAAWSMRRIAARRNASTRASRSCAAVLAASCCLSSPASAFHRQGLHCTSSDAHARLLQAFFGLIGPHRGSLGMSINAQSSLRHSGSLEVEGMDRSGSVGSATPQRLGAVDRADA